MQTETPSQLLNLCGLNAMNAKGSKKMTAEPMWFELFATNSKWPAFLTRHNPNRDLLRALKVSINKRISDYKALADFACGIEPARTIRFLMPTPKPPFNMSILISAFPSQGTAPYHGTLKCKYGIYTFKNTDAYHDAVIQITS